MLRFLCFLLFTSAALAADRPNVQLGDSGGYAANALTLAFYGTSSTLTLRNFNESSEDVAINKTNVTTGVWHHFAIVRSGTTLSLYVNGALASSDTA